MRVMIAGGSGLIGRELTMQLISAGDEVAILSRNPHKVVGLPPGVKLLQWDGITLQDWAQQVGESDAIVNLTGENISGEGFLPSRWTRQRKDRLVQSRVNSGKVLTRAIEMSGTRPVVFIQASGIGFYGTHQPNALTETDGPGNDFLANLSKQWEASSVPVEAMGVRHVVVRNGVVLSTKGGALPLIILPYKLFVGGPLGSGMQIYSWIHIDDEVAAIQFLIHHAFARGVFNLTSPNPVTNDEFGRTVGNVMQRPHYFRIPGFAMRLALGEVASTVLEGQKVLPHKLMEAGYVFKFPFLKDALKDIFVNTR